MERRCCCCNSKGGWSNHDPEFGIESKRLFRRGSQSCWRCRLVFLYMMEWKGGWEVERRGVGRFVEGRDRQGWTEANSRVEIDGRWGRCNVDEDGSIMRGQDGMEKTSPDVLSPTRLSCILVDVEPCLIIRVKLLNPSLTEFLFKVGRSGMRVLHGATRYCWFGYDCERV
jgi:hypothetical protein